MLQLLLYCSADLDYEAELCTIRSPFQSPFVKAFSTEPASALICNYSAALLASSSSSSSRREVHVVYLHVPSNNQSGEKNHRLPQVLVNIITSKENGKYHPLESTSQLHYYYYYYYYYYYLPEVRVIPQDLKRIGIEFY